MRKSDGLFLAIGYTVAAAFPDISCDDMLVDAAAMQLVKSPKQFDVMVTTNMFGDILSDEMAGLSGGLGVAPSANIGQHHGLFEPVHGSAPKYAGKNQANPTASILSLCLLLEYLQEAAVAHDIRRALNETLASGIKTKDIGGGQRRQVNILVLLLQHCIRQCNLMMILKIGGGRDINWDFIAQDLVGIHEEVVIVHGANAWMNDIAGKLGVEQKMITSPSGHISRYTDQATMDVLTMVYSGLMNKKIVATLTRHGINAVGLSGVDGKLWLGKKKDAILAQEGDKVKIIRDCLTGNVVSTNASLLTLLLKDGYVPVLTIPAVTPQGEMINVDNDRVAAVLAGDIHADKIVMLFEAPGFLDDVHDPRSRVPTIQKEAIETYMEKASGRMKKKLLGIQEAFARGVQTVYFGDGRVEHPIREALAGKGTIIS